VKPTLDGVDDGVAELGRLADRGVRVLNGPRTLLAAHDKLLTAREFFQAGVPHPATTIFTAADETPPLEPPVVIKPRYGSWGADVFRCDDGPALKRCLELLPQKHWFRAQGAIVQDLIPPRGWDLRLIVAAGRVIGAVSRVAAPGEWRTNVALGAVRAPVVEPLTQRELEVLRLVAKGYSYREIAEQLVISKATARTHVSRVIGKLGARDRAQLVVVAYQTGLVSTGPPPS
jgi:glutathione synthase/RimK-type ligase-like ATP-grasp enzyme